MPKWNDHNYHHKFSVLGIPTSTQNKLYTLLELIWDESYGLNHREIMPLGIAVACATWCHSSICQSGERRMSGHLYTMVVGYQIKAIKDNTMPATVNGIYMKSL